jgi:hypothetical protein
VDTGGVPPGDANAVVKHPSTSISNGWVHAGIRTRRPSPANWRTTGASAATCVADGSADRSLEARGQELLRALRPVTVLGQNLLEEGHELVVAGRAGVVDVALARLTAL